MFKVKDNLFDHITQLSETIGPRNIDNLECKVDQSGDLVT